VLATIMALTFVDCGSRAESSDWAWGKGRDRSSDGKVTGKGQCSSVYDWNLNISPRTTVSFHKVAYSRYNVPSQNILDRQ
jgi:hypothetical protein